MSASARQHRFTLTERMELPRIAVIGAGVAGSACAAELLRAGFDVTVFDKSRGLGGRMATRRAEWTDANGTTNAAAFDHGCPHFTATRPRFRALIDRAERLGTAASWQQRVYAAFPAPPIRHVVAPTPDMPAFCRHLPSDAPLCPGYAVTGLDRCADGWQLRFGNDEAAPFEHENIEGPFVHVAMAIPPAQAAMLLRGHHDEWAAALAAFRMAPCWTLIALTDDSDWPWDAAEPERSVLAWIGRDDRNPVRAPAFRAPPAGTVQWVAHATPAWSLAHLEDDPALVIEVLRDALGRLLTSGPGPRWHHTNVHRWRYARLGLAPCGDSFGDCSAGAAWCSGDELTDAVAASFDAEAGSSKTRGPIPSPVPEDAAERVH